MGNTVARSACCHSHADRMGVEVLAVGTELHAPPTGAHRGIALRDVESGNGVTHFLRIGWSRRVRERPRSCRRLGDEAARVFEEEFAVLLLEDGVHPLGVGVDVVVPVRNTKQRPSARSPTFL